MSTATALSLPDLAERINAEHLAAEEALNSGLEHALAAGRLLMEAKGLCAHGDWMSWLDENFDGSARTARAYMQIAEQEPALEANWQHAAISSIRGALRIAAPPKPNGKLAPPEPEQAPPVTCSNCGSHDVDEDGDCARCLEPDVAESGLSSNEDVAVEDDQPAYSGKAIQRGHEAINALCRIIGNDPKRRDAYDMVCDFIDLHRSKYGYDDVKRSERVTATPRQVDEQKKRLAEIAKAIKSSRMGPNGLTITKDDVLNLLGRLDWLSKLTAEKTWCTWDVRGGILCLVAQIHELLVKGESDR